MMIKRFILAAAAAVFTVLSSAQPVNYPLPQNPDSLRILVIANSYGDDSTQWLPDLLEAANIHNVTIARLYIGGCSLERHCREYQNRTENYRYQKTVDNKWTTVSTKTGILTGLEDEPWDIVTIHERSGYSGDYSHFVPWAGELIKIIRAHCPNPEATIVWNRTWAYARSSKHKDFPRYGNNQMIMYRGIVECSNRVRKEYNIPVMIPTGTAVQNARWTRGLADGKDLLRDGYHLNKGYTRYLAACTWFEALIRPVFGKSVKGNTFRMQGTEYEITPKMARKLQGIAIRTVREEK